jgi:hypothetical protein
MIRKPTPGKTEKKADNETEKEWENPSDPENAGDPREIEKLERAKKEAERQNENLTEEE